MESVFKAAVQELDGDKSYGRRDCGSHFWFDPSEIGCQAPCARRRKRCRHTRRRLC